MLGGGQTCDAYHITNPREDGGGVKLCLENALKDSCVDRDEVNYVNAHATRSCRYSIIYYFYIQYGK